MKCGLGMDSGILGDGLGIECLMDIPMEDMAMAILGELRLRRKR